MENKSFSLLDLAMIFLRCKKRIALHFISVLAVAVGVSYLIPKNYKATVLFLPPYEESSSLGGLSLGSILNIGINSAFTAEQIETLLESRRVLGATVKRFDLIHEYKLEKLPNKNEKALEKLKSNMKINAETQSGLGQFQIIDYSLSIVDKDANRAADIANYMIEQLGQSMNELSRGPYLYSEAFIRGRLDSVTTQKNLVQRNLAEFQKTHKVYGVDLQPQVKASIANYADLKREKTMSEIQREMLLFDREANSREVRLLDRKLRELDEKMNAIETDGRPDVLPGLNYSVDIAYEYFNLVQEAEVLSKLELLLRQQYEEARIKGARLAPLVRVVDPAKPPEWKNFPKKAIVVGVMVVTYMTFFLVWILASHGLSVAGPETRRKIAEFKEALKLRAG